GRRRAGPCWPPSPTRCGPLTFGSLVLAYEALAAGAVDRALEHLEDAHAIAGAGGDRMSVVLSLWGLGGAARRCGRGDGARARYQESWCSRATRATRGWWRSPSPSAPAWTWPWRGRSGPRASSGPSPAGKPPSTRAISTSWAPAMTTIWRRPAAASLARA